MTSKRCGVRKRPIAAPQGMNERGDLINMAEKEISAYFYSPDQALSIATKLRTLRAHDIRVERIPRDPFEDRMLFVPAAMLALGDGYSSEDREGTPGSTDTLLTAKIDEQAYSQASHLIRSNGGVIQTD